MRRLREVFSLLSSLYSVILLIGLFFSILVQIFPILENQMIVEVARYFTVVLISVLISYIAMARENSGLRRYLNCLNRVIIYDVRISGYMVQTIGDVYTGFLEGNLEHFDYVIRQIKRKEELLEQRDSDRKKYPALLVLPTKGTVSGIIAISKKWKIPFPELAHYLCSKLGKERAERLVKTETILKYYGKDEVTIWKSIIE